MFNRIFLVIGLFGGLMNIAACSPIVVWKEEVKLNDGRIIVVEQKKRADGPVAREAWLTINLPEFGVQSIVWHENLKPLIVNVDGGRLYVIGWPPTGLEIEQYGNQKPPYIGFIWEGGKFVRIPFEKIPEKIYSTNMLFDGFPPGGTSYLTIEKKNSKELNGNPLVQYLSRINPNMGCGC